jgi:hypothetical protein
MASPARTDNLVVWLAGLAEPDLREAWPVAWRYLAHNQPPDVVEALEVFRPVCEVLERGDRSLLDPLPPERREFAERVLERFEPTRQDNEETGRQPTPEESSCRG